MGSEMCIRDSADGVTVDFNDGCLDVKGKVGELKFDLPETVS